MSHDFGVPIDTADTARESVRWAARTIAVTERAAGASPEHVVVLLKKILTDAYDLRSGFIPIRPVREDVIGG
ncbi:MAG TPA: hypothetical protein VFA43_15950 [Gemmatimonadaceae bacterium]|nr:hypothetical protein [Gemmatimonadaceae bacterium]